MGGSQLSGPTSTDEWPSELRAYHVNRPPSGSISLPVASVRRTPTGGRNLVALPLETELAELDEKKDKRKSPGIKSIRSWRENRKKPKSPIEEPLSEYSPFRSRGRPSTDIRPLTPSTSTTTLTGAIHYPGVIISSSPNLLNAAYVFPVQKSKKADVFQDTSRPSAASLLGLDTRQRTSTTPPIPPRSADRPIPTSQRSVGMSASVEVRRQASGGERGMQPSGEERISDGSFQRSQRPGSKEGVKIPLVFAPTAMGPRHTTLIRSGSGGVGEASTSEIYISGYVVFTILLLPLPSIVKIDSYPLIRNLLIFISKVTVEMFRWLYHNPWLITSDTPIHQRPLPPLPNGTTERQISLNATKAIRKLRTKNGRPTTAIGPGLPSIFGRQNHPDTSSISLSSGSETREEIPVNALRATERKTGLSALSFLALNDSKVSLAPSSSRVHQSDSSLSPFPTRSSSSHIRSSSNITSEERNSQTPRQRRTSHISENGNADNTKDDYDLDAHIIPPSELRKICSEHHRRTASSSAGSDHLSSTPSSITFSLHLPNENSPHPHLKHIRDSPPTPIQSDILTPPLQPTAHLSPRPPHRKRPHTSAGAMGGQSGSGGKMSFPGHSYVLEEQNRTWTYAEEPRGEYYRLESSTFQQVKVGMFQEPNPRLPDDLPRSVRRVMEEDNTSDHVPIPVKEEQRQVLGGMTQFSLTPPSMTLEERRLSDGSQGEERIRIEEDTRGQIEKSSISGRSSPALSAVGGSSSVESHSGRERTMGLGLGLGVDEGNSTSRTAFGVSSRSISGTSGKTSREELEIGRSKDSDGGNRGNEGGLEIGEEMKRIGGNDGNVSNNLQDDTDSSSFASRKADRAALNAWLASKPRRRTGSGIGVLNGVTRIGTGIPV
ncbi:hypothetical protein TREMEDRAFT_59583 [Tremella mesenterica DSM 1558]|uniref:uncharacterized protein n=1 Tax=Tremella mesenterica (strain ATCC 24925 / CBS 8224 / DSM 1558 / NBRC 9311 / NRRL Y-6157 / RJB 2259-6 / UBC 559-6) TaxID=578456 RepID=UPI0003F4A5F1|nr:uncharacterized protein TREMEDRAFT_59583 [Tremella mesenterica DSM 1558]EIW73419.1 hypothetical protein TREMEDRAFT_59583 [Tremella mesenterica DSM 1558]